MDSISISGAKLFYCFGLQMFLVKIVLDLRMGGIHDFFEALNFKNNFHISIGQVSTGNL
jgi:hypothetical protein